MRHLRLLGSVSVKPFAFDPELYRTETWRQNAHGTAHADTESLYLRMPPVISRASIFESLEVVDRALYAGVKPYINTICGVLRLGLPARVMLVALKPGGVIAPHIDEGAYAEATIRYHIAVLPNEQSYLHSGGDVCCPNSGDVWWFDKSVMHAANNAHSWLSRVHLILDCWKPAC